MRFAAPLLVDASDLDSARFAVGTDEDALIIEVPKSPAPRVLVGVDRDERGQDIGEDYHGADRDDSPTPASWKSTSGHPGAPSYPTGSASFTAAKWKLLRSIDSLWGSIAGGASRDGADGGGAVADDGEPLGSAGLKRL